MAAGQPDHDAANIHFLRCGGKSSVDLSLCGRGGVCETEAILKLISSVHEGCDLPVQTFSPCPCFRHKGWFASRWISFHPAFFLCSSGNCSSFVRICKLIEFLSVTLMLTGVFQVKWRQRARRMMTMTMTAKRAPWMRCVSLMQHSYYIIVKLYLWEVLACHMVRLPSSDHVCLCTYLYSVRLSQKDSLKPWFGEVSLRIFLCLCVCLCVFMYRAPQAVRHSPQKKCPIWSSTSSQWSSTALRLPKVCEINNLGRVKTSRLCNDQKGCISPQRYPSMGILGQKCIEKNILHPVASTPSSSSKVQAFSDSYTQEAPPIFKFAHYGLSMLNI